MKIEEILAAMESIQYGFTNQDKKIFKDEDMVQNHYCLQTPEEILETKVGVCWDQVELERYYFDKAKIPARTFCLIAYNDSSCPTHTFLIYQYDNHYFWFEHSWSIFQGIHEYSSLMEALKDVKKRFIAVEIEAKGIEGNVILYEYDNPPKHASVEEFYHYIEKNPKIEIH